MGAHSSFTPTRVHVLGPLEETRVSGELVHWWKMPIILKMIPINTLLTCLSYTLLVTFQWMLKIQQTSPFRNILTLKQRKGKSNSLNKPISAVFATKSSVKWGNNITSEVPQHTLPYRHLFSSTLPSSFLITHQLSVFIMIIFLLGMESVVL